MTLFHIRTLALATLTTLLFACNGKGNAPQKQSERQTTNDSTLRIAVMPTLDCLPLYVAHQRAINEVHGSDGLRHGHT